MRILYARRRIYIDVILQRRVPRNQFHVRGAFASPVSVHGVDDFLPLLLRELGHRTSRPPVGTNGLGRTGDVGLDFPRKIVADGVTQ